jgi:hypothetical protein
VATFCDAFPENLGGSADEPETVVIHERQITRGASLTWDIQFDPEYTDVPRMTVSKATPLFRMQDGLSLAQRTRDVMSTRDDRKNVWFFV